MEAVGTEETKTGPTATPLLQARGQGRVRRYREEQAADASQRGDGTHAGQAKIRPAQ